MDKVRSTDAFSRDEVRRILKIHENSLRSWERHGFAERRVRFEFRDLAELQQLKRLSRRVPPKRMKAFLTALRRAGVRRPLLDVRVDLEGSLPVVENDRGLRLDPVTRQQWLPLAPMPPVRVHTLDSARPLEDGRRLRQAESFFQMGLQLEESGGPLSDAAAAYRSAVELNPAAAGAWVNLGTLSYRTGDFIAAEECYRKAVEAVPGYSLAHFNLGNVFEEQRRLPEAAECYERALRLDPSYADAHYNLALVYERLREPMRSAKHWRAYLKLDPSSPWANVARQQLQALVEVRPGGGGKSRAAARGQRS